MIGYARIELFGQMDVYFDLEYVTFRGIATFHILDNGT